MAVRGVVFRLTGQTKEARTDLDIVSEKLKKITDKLHKVRLKLDDDGAKLKLDAIGARLDKIGNKVVRPRVTIEGFAKAFAEAEALQVKMDRLGNTNEKSRFGISALWSGNAIGRMFTGKQGTMGGFPSFLASPVGIGAGATALGFLSSLIPGLLGGALTLGVGGAGLFGASKLDPKAFAKAFSPVSGEMKTIFGGIARESMPMLHQVALFVKSLGPDLNAMFKAALPGVSAFIKGLEPAVSAILPQLTQVIKSMTPLMASLGSSFGLIIRGIVGALVNMQGAFRASASIIHGTSEVLDVVFRALGSIVSVFTRTTRLEFQAISDFFHGKWRKTLEDLRNMTGVAMSAVAGFFKRYGNEIVHGLDDLRHTAASIFDRFLNGIHMAWSAFANFESAFWNRLWAETIGKIIRGVGDVGKWFTTMKLNIGSILSGLPGMLYRIGVNVLNSLISGLKSAAGPLISFVNWVSGLISSIGSFFGIGGHAPAAGLHMPSGVKAPAMFLSPPAPSAAPAPAYAGPVGGVFIVNFNGVQGNPDAIAQQIHQIMRDYKKHRGNMALGLA